MFEYHGGQTLRTLETSEDLPPVVYRGAWKLTRTLSGKMKNQTKQEGTIDSQAGHS